MRIPWDLEIKRKQKTDLAIYVLYIQYTPHVCFCTGLLGTREGQKGREGVTESAGISRASRASN